MPNVPYPLRGGDFKDYSDRDKEIALKGKFWAKIHKNLLAVKYADAKNQDSRVYFAGGTLCVDLPHALYLMSVSGKGFITSLQNFPAPVSKKVYLPNFILQLVQAIYLDTMGMTDYFKENYKDIAWV